MPTPIGNLEDMTFRGVRILQECSLILAEDTRTSQRLLQHYGIRTKMVSHHKYNEHASVNAIAARIAEGMNVALISDAGTPGISDPGFLLVRTCIENSIEVDCLPGATAFIPALINSGFPCDRFVFEGFLPQKKGRQKRLSALKEEYRTIILYESPFRLVRLLEELHALFGDGRKCCVCRELSKMFQENIRGPIPDVLTHFNQHPPKGEIVVVVENDAGKKNDK